MSRLIKFRAWLKEHKKMAGYISHFKSVSVGVFEITVPFEDVNSDMVLKTFRDFDLMQFTGLFDEGGLEIYEGDIVKRICTDPDCDLEHKGVVTWSGKWAMWGIDEKDPNRKDYLAPLAFGNAKKGITLGIQKLGNVYENPEILKS